MRPRHFAPDIHRPLTLAGETSSLEIECLSGPFEGYLCYRLNDGPSRTIAPGHWLCRTLAELLRVIHAKEHPLVDEYERELHEDVLAYEQELQERENARLYGVAERQAGWRVRSRAPVG